MAYVASHRVSHVSLGDHAANLIAAFRQARARRAVYARTFGELSAMTDRDLADIGIARDQIADIALEAAYGK